MKNHIDAIISAFFDKPKDKKILLQLLFSGAFEKDDPALLSLLVSELEAVGVDRKEIFQNFSTMLTQQSKKDFQSVSVFEPYLIEQSNRDLSNLYTSTENAQLKEKIYTILWNNSVALTQLNFLDQGQALLQQYEAQKITASEIQVRMKAFFASPEYNTLLASSQGSNKEEPNYKNDWGKSAVYREGFNVLERDVIKPKLLALQKSIEAFYKNPEHAYAVGDFVQNSPLKALATLTTLETQTLLATIDITLLQKILSHPNNTQKDYNTLLSKALGSDKPFHNLPAYEPKNKTRETVFLQKVKHILIDKPELLEHYSAVIHAAGLPPLFRLMSLNPSKDKLAKLAPLNITQILHHIVQTFQAPKAKKAAELFLVVSVALEKEVLSQGVAVSATTTTKPSGFKI